jgi:phage gp46-like protein
MTFDRFQGDPKIWIDENGSYVEFSGGQPIMDGGLENAVTLSLFTQKGYVGNVLEISPDNHLGSDFEIAANQPINLAMLTNVRVAAEAALNWMQGAGLVREINVTVTNPRRDTLEIIIQIVRPDGGLEKILLAKNGINWVIQSQYPASNRNKSFKPVGSRDYTHGVNKLNPILTINGVQSYSSIRYNGLDAGPSGWNPWVYGGPLTLTAGTPPSYNQGPPPGTYNWDNNTDSVKFNNGAAFEDTTGTHGQVTTGDILLEVVARQNQNTNDQIIGTYDGSLGWLFYHANNRFRLVMKDSGGLIEISTAVASVTIGTYYHLFIYVNRDEASTNGAQWFMDGIANGSGKDVSGISGDLTSTNFTIGRQSGGGLSAETNLVIVNLWTGSDLIQAGVAGKSEIAAIALARSNAFWNL